nr:hypothetical protein [Marinobacter sp. ELB17]
MSEIAGELNYDVSRHLFLASPTLALADMQRFNRPTINLVTEV